jgi:hypothetical protein
LIGSLLEEFVGPIFEDQEAFLGELERDDDDDDAEMDGVTNAISSASEVNASLEVPSL